MTVEFYLTRRFGLIFEVVQGKGMHTSHSTFVVLQNLLFYIILVLHLFSFWQFLCKQVINWLVVWFLHIRLAIKLYHDQYVFICTIFFFWLLVIESIAVIHYDIIGCFCVLYMASGRYTTKVDDINWLLWGSFQEGDIKIWSH